MGLFGQIFLASIPILMSMYAARYREEDRLTFLKEMDQNLGLPLEEEFDFIIGIVGGGTAGCVLARRLSDAQFSVLLLEAGGNPSPMQAVRAAHVGKEFNFDYRSTPQSNAGLSDDGIVHFPTAKMLGGGSSHNEMHYERGHPRGYEKWAEITGDPSWSYPELLKYFLKAENFSTTYIGGSVTSNVSISEGQHGVNGPMTVTQPESPENIVKLFYNAAAELGYATDIDPNGPQRQGFSRMEFTRDTKGRRVSTYTAYVKPIETDPRSKLTLRRYSSGQKVIFENKTATGVLYNRHGVPRIARATKEVILSAGSYMSPVLLILSGVGPEDQLKLTQVDPVAILPVGYNMMDHVKLNLRFSVEDKSYVWSVQDNLTSADVTSYLENGAGPLGEGKVVAHIASVGTREQEQPAADEVNVRSTSESEWPDLLYFLQGVTGCFFMTTRPNSRGRITVNVSAVGGSEDDDDFLPIIDPNYYNNERDFNATIYGIETCLKLFEETDAFRKIGGRYAEGPIEGCERFEFKSRDYWKCYIRQMASSSDHICCTNKMGPMEDGNSVVDPKFRVFGVQNLRVVDASVMPTIQNANTAAPVVALAEKAADIIIQHYSNA